MFYKNRFSKILKDINHTYDSMSEFAKKSSVDRSYISKYINLKYDSPPSAEILKKISDASNNVTTYYELLILCGYIDLGNVFVKTPNGEDTNFSYWSKRDLENLGISKNDVETLSHNTDDMYIEHIFNIIKKYPKDIQDKFFIKLIKYTFFSETVLQKNDTLDVSGLDPKDIEELKRQVEYMRWKKQNNIN